MSPNIHKCTHSAIIISQKSIQVSSNRIQVSSHRVYVSANKIHISANFTHIYGNLIHVGANWNHIPVNEIHVSLYGIILVITRCISSLQFMQLAFSYFIYTDYPFSLTKLPHPWKSLKSKIMELCRHCWLVVPSRESFSFSWIALIATPRFKTKLNTYYWEREVVMVSNPHESTCFFEGERLFVIDGWNKWCHVILQIIAKRDHNNAVFKRNFFTLGKTT